MKWFGIVALIWAVISIFIVKKRMEGNKFQLEVNNKKYVPNFWGKWLIVFLVPLLLLLLLAIVITIAVPVFFTIIIILFILVGIAVTLYFLRLFL